MLSVDQRAAELHQAERAYYRIAVLCERERAAVAAKIDAMPPSPVRSGETYMRKVSWVPDLDAANAKLDEAARSLAEHEAALTECRVGLRRGEDKARLRAEHDSLQSGLAWRRRRVAEAEREVAVYADFHAKREQHHAIEVSAAHPRWAHMDSP